LKIANNSEAATFENTIIALEKSGEVLKRTVITFSNLTSANTNPTLQALDEEYAPIFAAHSDKMFLNENLYKRIKSITENGLDSESKRLLQFYKQNFEIAGANLSAADKEKLKQVNQELASLSTQYSNKLLEARKQGGVFFSDAKELDGLSTDEIEAAASDAKNAGQPGKYLLALQNTTQQPLLQNLKNRATREKLFKASWQRAEKDDANDTRETIEKLAKLRLKKAQILGKKKFRRMETSGSDG
jgi:peptidyl-dipeptidase Dcp